MKASFFSLVKSIPIVRKKIEKELENTVKSIEENFDPKGQAYIQNLPDQGLSEVTHIVI